MPDDVRISVEGLEVGFRHGRRILPVVDGVSLELRGGEMLALLGESGSGKSMTALSLLGLLPRPAGCLTGGSAWYHGEDIYHVSEESLRKLRGRRIAMIFQEPMTALNPVLTIGDQLREVLSTHFGMGRREADERAAHLLREVEIPEAESRLASYPHQLSGGLRQRVMIAMALAGEPEIIVADEPTTALDVTVQAQIISLLTSLQKRHGTSILLITHNLALAAQGAQRCAVMYAGQLVEVAPSQEFFRQPMHPYTRLLLQALPRADARGRELETISGAVPRDWSVMKGCRFAPRCPFATERCLLEPPGMREISPGHECRCLRVAELAAGFSPARLASTGETADEARQEPPVVLRAENLRVWFTVMQGLFRQRRKFLKAVDGVDLEIREGETLALVGESGCGKSTVGKALVRLLKPTSGRFSLSDGRDLASLPERQLGELHRQVQMIFQDPFSSLDPRLMVGESLGEALDLRHPKDGVDERRSRVEALLETVGLSAEDRLRYPHQFSGGQRQRIGLARALAAEPRLVVCDECTSALDVSIQAQMLNLLKEIQRRLRVAYLFITHDLSVVGYLSDRIAVMYLGRILEEGSAEEVLASPRHPYTQALLAAAPRLDASTDGGLQASEPGAPLEGEVPSPLAPPTGCPFHPRCPHATARCTAEFPEWRNASANHKYRCLL